MTERARASARGPRGWRRGRQGGFTLIELMIALLVSSLLVGMILAIFSRMSLAYRGQQQIAGVQQVLAAARGLIELDAKQAGLGVAPGFTTNLTGASVLSPVQVFDGGNGPDLIKFFYADTSTQAVVKGKDDWPNSLDLDPATGPLPIDVDPVALLSPGDLIVLSRAITNMPDNLSPYGGANRVTYTACVMRISPASGSVVLGSSGSPDHIVLDTALPWGWGTGNGPCAEPPMPGQTMVYRFVAHAYRIDTSTPERAALGPLQQSPTGGLLGGDADDWNDLAYGFTDLQTAERFVLLGASPAAIDPDGDGDNSHDWYSDATQGAMNTVPPDPTPPVVAAQPKLMQMSISLVARTDHDVEGIATQKTPKLIDLDHPNNNPLGNRDSIDLSTTTDPALQGQRIYRYITFQVDFRNLGVGL